ncbi:metallopeptidase family protein [Longimicrobium terrae]|uniref:Metallopeptidase family protein n=1 Tax=Longimicrobium terrae TaxID=1639882 RepID=A0A841H7B6_9BACT|nr:metallopeptidase family protein [Longimicrobium terrae]MBB4639664.1 hypothetical protein [Longimicrobium terrae]MBB6074051.1 hypothetical protein [Longimicrobium terrae]NNC32646.1 hypothetical protein [Longimicrobium terrae]
MTFEEFESEAHRLFATIPPEFRGGVETVRVSGRTVLHPELPDVYTMGECATGELDYEDGVPEPTRSEVRLFYGSFRALAEQDEDFDWQGELWETLTHEIRHHRESAAGEDALEDYDDASDENFKRRDGLSFDPFFYRGGEPAGEGVWEVDDDVFVEMIVDERRVSPEQDIEVIIDGERIGVPVPDDLGDVCFLYLEGFGETPGDVTVVLVRRIGFWEQLRTLFRREEPIVAEWTLAEGDWVRRGPAGDRPD